MVTSVSLPVAFAACWRQNRAAIMEFADRYLCLAMHFPVRREVTRTYNRGKGEFEIVNTRFSPAEYDALHCVATALRVSVSSLIYGLIKLWLKPVRRNRPNRMCANYSLVEIVWNPEGGILEESLTFWRRTTENPEGRPLTLPAESSGSDCPHPKAQSSA